MTQDPKRYCGIVFIGGGSSWLYGPKVEGLAVKAAKLAKEDWGGIFKFDKRQKLNVVIVDTLGYDGWFANAGEGIFGTKKGNEPVKLEPLKVETVIV